MRIGQDVVRQATAQLLKLVAQELSQLSSMATQGAQGTQAAQAQFAASCWEGPRPQTPVDQARADLTAEAQRLEQDKYTFPPETQSRIAAMNKGRAELNVRLQGEVQETEKKLAALEKAPDNFFKKLMVSSLENKLKSLHKEIKEPLDLPRITKAVDNVMQANLSEDERKEALARIRDNIGMTVEDMHELVTEPLSKKYDASKQRVEASGKAATQAIALRIQDAEKRYGKDSPVVKALKEQKEVVGKAYGETAKHLSDTSGALHDAFRKKGFWESIGNFFSGIGKAIGKALDFVMPVLSFIPGVGQIAGAVWAGVKAVGAAIKGDWGGMLSSLAGAIPGVGKALGGAAEKVLTTVGKVINYGQKGINVAQDVARGDILGALVNGASLAGGATTGKLSTALTNGAKAVGVAQQAANGNIAGALAGASSFLGDGKAANVLSEGAKVAGAVQQVAAGNYAGALSSVSGLLTDAGENKAAKLFSDGARAVGVVEQAASGDVLGALGNATDFLPKRTRETVQNTANDAGDAFQRIGRGDLDGASEAFLRAANEAPAFLRDPLRQAALLSRKADTFETQVERQLHTFETQVERQLRSIF
ncbi:MAG TPA: hypothetical protein VK447_06195 [Myxococcaceae bacterium]|nr:hypothetical protein [Myxococcaceae bacterium]